MLITNHNSGKRNIHYCRCVSILSLLFCNYLIIVILIIKFLIITEINIILITPAIIMLLLKSSQPWLSPSQHRYKNHIHREYYHFIWYDHDQLPSRQSFSLLSSPLNTIVSLTKFRLYCSNLSYIQSIKYIIHRCQFGIFLWSIVKQGNSSTPTVIHSIMHNSTECNNQMPERTKQVVLGDLIQPTITPINSTNVSDVSGEYYLC